MRQLHERSRVEVGLEVTVKHFSTLEGARQELTFYQLVPWACPELLEFNELSMTIRTLPVATEVPDWQPKNALRRLLRNIHGVGIHHRDVHVKNVLRGPDGPVLIDWECAVIRNTPLSYDLDGPSISGVPVPDLHQQLQAPPAWWYSSDRFSIANWWG